jgi:hypothetical protein
LKITLACEAGCSEIKLSGLPGTRDKFSGCRAANNTHKGYA